MIDATLEMQLFNMTAENGLVNLPDNSIDLVVTSPPYGNLRTYGGYNQYDFPIISKQLYRVMKPGGVVVWIVNDETKTNKGESLESFRQAIGFQDVGFLVWDTMIFGKINPIPLNHRRYQQEFEFMFVLSKGVPKTFNPIEIECLHAGRLEVYGRKSRTWHGRGHAFWNYKEEKRKEVKNKKPAGNVFWYTVGGGDTGGHPAPFPEKLAEDHIVSWSNPGDLVMDIFLGSGTTAKMTKIHGRRFIGFEVNPEYFEIAKKRIDFPVNKRLF